MLALSGNCNAARNIGQFAIVQIILNRRNIMYWVELQIHNAQSGHYNFRLAGGFSTLKMVEINLFGGFSTLFLDEII